MQRVALNRLPLDVLPSRARHSRAIVASRSFAAALARDESRSINGRISVKSQFMTNDAHERYSQLYHADLGAWSLLHTEASAYDALPKTVGFLSRRRDGKLGVLVREPLDESAAAALDGRVFALAGTAALVRSIERGFVPSAVEMLAIRGASPADLEALAAAPLLDHIEALAVLDGEPRTRALEALLARRMPALRSLSILDATDALVRSLREPLLSQLATLRIAGPMRAAPTTRLDLSRVLSGDRRAITTLDLAGIELTPELVAAWGRGDWSRLERLRVHVCNVHAALLGPFAALRELRSDGWSWDGPRSLSDESVAGIVASSPDLEIVSLEHSDAGDRAAFALAEHGRRLVFFNLDKTRVSSAGAIALGRSTVFERLEFAQLDAPLSFDAAHALADSTVAAIRQNAHGPYRGLATIVHWAPPTPAQEATRAPVSKHAFRWQRYQQCQACGGRPSFDGCPWHEPLVIHPVARGDEPPTEESRAWVAAHGAHMTRVEQLGHSMLETMRSWGKYAGPLRVTWWVIDRDHRGCDLAQADGPSGLDAIIDAVGRPPYATTASWAFACARARAQAFAHLPDPYTPARTIAELGASIVGLDAEDGLLIALRTQ